MEFNGNLTPISQDCLCSFHMTKSNSYRVWNVFAFNCPRFIHKVSGKDIIAGIINDTENYKVSFSPFFKNICDCIESKGWVDIEEEYYVLLRNVVMYPDRYNYTLSELNSHLYRMQELLTEYLLSIQLDEKGCNVDIQRQIYSPLRKNDICISQLQTYYDYIDYILNQENEYQRMLYRYGFEYQDIYCKVEELKRLKQQYSKSQDIKELYLKDLIFPENILLLNFNYTDVADKYGSHHVATVNHIHGKLDSPEKMIFGYGDELDEDYKTLLKQTDYEVLKNIKSIKYLESSNYRNMLQFIESMPYQVYVMGHSCGNSDRTLLNTLFEHKNCVSIKPYYYQKEDGSDNYLEIVQNICRNFTDMKLMRDRVVNKTYCEPLPQSSKYLQ